MKKCNVFAESTKPLHRCQSLCQKIHMDILVHYEKEIAYDSYLTLISQLNQKLGTLTINRLLNATTNTNWMERNDIKKEKEALAIFDGKFLPSTTVVPIAFSISLNPSRNFNSLHYEQKIVHIFSQSCSNKLCFEFPLE